MKLKKIIFVLLSCFTFQHSFAQYQSLSELRAQYMDALHDCEFAPTVYDVFTKVKNPSGKVLAYKGALEAIMTKTTWNLFKKISYLNKSEESFKAAIEKSPNDLEIRFMRMAVQFEIPEYLGYSKDIETDRAFIVEHIHEFNPTNFPKGTLKEIFGFMNRCNKFTKEQVERFKNILALK